MGFDALKFVSKVSEDRKCSICHLVLDNPVKTPCSHVFCSGCILPWVVRHASCPLKCQPLTTSDLDNVLPLRELVLNMKVVCDNQPNGCTEHVRLVDLPKHLQKCELRSVECRNKGCDVKRPIKLLALHEVHECDFRPVGICKDGCDMILLHISADQHNCVDTLKEQLNKHEDHIARLEHELLQLTTQLKQREKQLLTKVTTLQKKLQLQTVRFKNQLIDYESQIPSENNNKCDSTCGRDDKLTLVLERTTGTLGFNIMGGFVAENNNNNNNNNNNKDGMVTEGIIVSKVTDGGPAQLKGLKNHDQIVKVNGLDLSEASHEEAVEAFRTAEEPIVVEVLRRVNKNKMKTRSSPAMVSIGTQTEEDIYGYNRPPTPPPAFYPFPYSGLLEPSSRRPVVFSQNTEMGLTDIEMGQFDYDDPYYDDRQYEVEYEEVVLQRPGLDEKLGLTLCYGPTEEGVTDIFIGEIDPYSVAAKDGRIREGDQIVQINNVDVQSRDQAIKLFSDKSCDITLLLARPQIQFDDGFMEEHNVVLDELQMDILEKHHHDNMQIMASMLARGHHFDEEGGTTDTGTTENSSQKHEKDSGVGRTDESTKNDESSEQDNESMMGTRKSGSSKGTQSYNGDVGDQNFSNESFVSNENCDRIYDVPETDCNKFREVLVDRCDKNNLNRVNSPRKNKTRRISESTESSVDKELAQLNKEMEGIQMECQEMVNNHVHQNKLQSTTSSPKSEMYKTPRSVPRMGTRIEYAKTGVSPSPESSDSIGRRDTPPTPKMGQTRIGKFFPDKDGNVSTSAYNTGESCRSTPLPLMLELNMASDEGEKGFKNSMLCLASTNTESLAPSHSDTEKQTQTFAPPVPMSQGGSSDENYASIANSHKVEDKNRKNENVKCQLNQGESLQDLYMQYADVMYTNPANLEHTIQIQQKLFQQQIDQKTTHRKKKSSSSASKKSSMNGNQSPSDSPQYAQPTGTGETPPDSGQMEWVVKRRPDGTRYIARRPIRSKLLKERAKKISEERCGMTTDDDAMSELKTGRYWSKGDRKRHLEKSRDQKRKRELMARAKMETLKESDEKKEMGIVELSHRKMMKHKGKRVFDDFTTVQEMLAHGSKTEGKTYNPLLSVTTV